jgi:hypothetical protein
VKIIKMARSFISVFRSRQNAVLRENLTELPWQNGAESGGMIFRLERGLQNSAKAAQTMAKFEGFPGDFFGLFDIENNYLQIILV